MNIKKELMAVVSLFVNADEIPESQITEENIQINNKEKKELEEVIKKTK